MTKLNISILISVFLFGCTKEITYTLKSSNYLLDKSIPHYILVDMNQDYENQRLILEEYIRKGKLRLIFRPYLFPTNNQRLKFGSILKFSNMKEASFYIDNMKKDGVISDDLEVFEISETNLRMLMSQSVDLGITEYITFYYKHFGKY